MNESQLTVHVIDDDPSVLQSVTELLNAAGIPTRTYSSAEQFLHALSSTTSGCIVTDLQMQGMSGADLLHVLQDVGCHLPVVVVSGHADVPVTVDVMEHGAITLLEKPYRPQQLLAAVQRALEAYRSEQERVDQLDDIRFRIASLQPEEHSVMTLMVQGKPNKVIASELGVSMRTVDRRRSAVLEKMGVGSAPEVARLIGLLESVKTAD